jgi:hypothetical protein
MTYLEVVYVVSMILEIIRVRESRTATKRHVCTCHRRRAVHANRSGLKSLREPYSAIDVLCVDRRIQSESG